MPIFQESLNPFGKAFGDMSPSGRNNAYANSIMFNAVGNKIREGRKLAARNNLSYGGVDDNGEHIFAPAGVYQPIQEAAEGIAGFKNRLDYAGPPAPIDPNLEMIGGPLTGPPPLPVFDFDYPEPAPPTNSQVTDPYFQQPITDDPYQYAQPAFNVNPLPPPPPITPVEFPTKTQEQLLFEEVMASSDPFGRVFSDEGPIGNVLGVESDFGPTEAPGEGTFGPGVGLIEDQIGDPSIRPPIPTDTTIIGDNPFYTGATNVAQPPNMTPVAPSFSLDVGVGGYGTPTNTAGFGNMGGYFTPSTTTNSPVGAPFLPTITSSTPNQAIYDYYTQPATTAAPQTTTTPLPTVNSFAGFNGFGGFGGF